MLFKVPDNVPDELAVFADPFAVSLHAITATPRRRAARSWSTAPARSARARPRSCGRCIPTSRCSWSRASRRRPMARKLGAQGDRARARACESSRSWRRGRAACSHASDGLPMALPGLHRRRLRHRRQAGDVRGRRARAQAARGTLVKSGVHGPTWWEDTPLYFKEISMVGSNAFGFEEVDGVRKHGIDHYLDLVSSRPGRPHRHADAHVPARRWRDAFGPSPARTRAAPSKSPSRRPEPASLTTMPRTWDRRPRRAPRPGPIR